MNDQQLSLLIVEDNKGIRATYELILAKTHLFRFATTCAEAREAMTQGYYDLILLDIELPDGNGLELLKEIRATLPEQEIIMASAQTDAHFVVEAMKHGAIDFIPKPIDREILLRTLERASRTHRLAWEKTILLQKVEESGKREAPGLSSRR